MIALALALLPGTGLAEPPPVEAEPPPAEIEAPPAEAEPAAVEPTKLDEVQRVSGDLIRGTIVEVVDGSHVTIAVAGSGEQVQVPWADVARVTRASSTPPPAPVVPAPVVDDEPALPVGPGRPHLELIVEGDEAAKLYRIAIEANIATTDGGAHATGYVIECPAPCRRIVDGSKGEEFFVGGPRITESHRFDLSDREGHWKLHVRPGKKAAYGVGLALTCFGGAFGGGGIFLTAAGAKLLDNDGLRNAGIGMLVSGLVAIAVGVPLLVRGRTRVRWSR